MGYFHLHNSLKIKNKVYFFNYDQNAFFEGVYRKFALFVSPLIIGLNPNLISFLSLIFGFAGLFISLIYKIKISYILCFFFTSFILDFCDGIVARHKKQSSFYGRFIDGLFDVLVIGFLHIILLNYLLKTDNNYFNINFYYIAILILPIQHLILDRFSAMARWCNETNPERKLKPYYRNNFLRKITMSLFDLQHLSLFLLLIISSLSLSHVLIEAYYLLSFTSSISSIIIYIYLGKKFFSEISNQLDNNE